MRPNNFWNVQRVENEKNRISQLTLMLRDFYNILSGGIVFEDNFRGVVLNVNLIVGENAITHNLNYNADNYILVNSGVSNQSLSNGSTANTKTTIYLNATQSGSARLWVF